MHLRSRTTINGKPCLRDETIVSSCRGKYLCEHWQYRTLCDYLNVEDPCFIKPHKIIAVFQSVLSVCSIYDLEVSTVSTEVLALIDSTPGGSSCSVRNPLNSRSDTNDVEITGCTQATRDNRAKSRRDLPNYPRIAREITLRRDTLFFASEWKRRNP